MMRIKCLTKLFTTVLISFSLLSCATPPEPSTYTVYLTRHFEKTSESSDPGLTPRGQKQAEIFASLLDNKPITAIYSTNYQRTQQSAMPLAAALNLPIQEYDPRQPDTLIARVSSNPTDQVIVGHSNTIPELVELLGGEAKAIAESEYGLVFAVSITLLEGQQVRNTTRKILLLDKVSG